MNIKNVKAAYALFNFTCVYARHVSFQRNARAGGLETICVRVHAQKDRQPRAVSISGGHHKVLTTLYFSALLGMM